MAYTLSTSTAVTTVGTTGGIVDAADIELINHWMKPTEPHEHELLQWLGPLRKKVNQQTHYIGQSYNPPVSTTLENATASADPTIDMTGTPASLGFKVGHLVRIRDYYAGQTTYFDPTKTTYHRITQVDAGSVEASANIGAVHPAGAVVDVYSTAVPMATAFGVARSYQGDRIAQTVQRLESGLLPVDKRMRNTPTHESRDKFLDDIEAIRDYMNDELEGAYINSTYVAESGATPGQIRGMIDWADEISANVLDLAGKQISIHHFRDRVTAKRKTHSKRAGKTVILDLDSMSAIDLVLEPYKLYNEKSNTVSIQVDKLNFRWGDLSFMPLPSSAAPYWPDGTALITDKGDWGAGNYDGMPWTPVRMQEEHTGAPVEKFGIYGDFTIDCYDVYRQILIKNINTFVDRYAGRRTYGQAG